MHIDVLVAMASGLPPLVDSSTCDVRPLTELKDEYIGTPEGIEYDQAVSNGTRPKAHADDPDSANKDSPVWAGGILVCGKLRTTGKFAQRRPKLALTFRSHDEGGLGVALPDDATVERRDY